jgi:hypothetical protein
MNPRVKCINWQCVVPHVLMCTIFLYLVCSFMLNCVYLTSDCHNMPSRVLARMDTAAWSYVSHNAIIVIFLWWSPRSDAHTASLFWPAVACSFRMPPQSPFPCHQPTFSRKLAACLPTEMAGYASKHLCSHIRDGVAREHGSRLEICTVWDKSVKCSPLLLALRCNDSSRVPLIYAITKDVPIWTKNNLTLFFFTYVQPVRFL